MYGVLWEVSKNHRQVKELFVDCCIITILAMHGSRCHGNGTKTVWKRMGTRIFIEAIGQVPGVKNMGVRRLTQSGVRYRRTTLDSF